MIVLTAHSIALYLVGSISHTRIAEEKAAFSIDFGTAANLSDNLIACVRPLVLFNTSAVALCSWLVFLQFQVNMGHMV